MSLTTGRRRRRKRKASEEETHFALDELINQDILEKILSCLPSSAFFRLRSVCRKWNSVIASTAFRIACSQILYRDPWFLMVDQHLDHSIIFDTSAGNWMKLNKPSRFNEPDWIAVASSGGLVCFRRTSGELMACNPLTGSCREIPPANQAQPPVALAMSSSCNYNGYRIVLVTGELSDLCYRVFDSEIKQWEDEVVLVRAADSSPETEVDETVYFIDKSGDVVATNIQRNPSKQFSAVMSFKNGEEIVYFVSHLGLIVACNLTLGSFHEYPNLLPLCSEYSIDVVLCRKEMMVVLLSEFLETASLRLWKFCEVEREWRQVAAMAPAMSHEFYGKKTDINCIGCGDLILVCLNSIELSRYVMYNVVVDEWVELPGCFVDGKGKDFMAAFSFEPRLEVAV
ncbi:F-box only protein 13 [Platanthera guangdongensis]|uniref:F-box only protein 13 n=1 Tax=Platanthera guangdongensis TaxID=2320717 RepID=A0ABR2N3W9_9ASPA